MKLVTAEQMRRLEELAAEAGIPSSILMDNAGLAVAQEVRKLLPQVDARVLVLVGPGNNGGDGLVAARHLHDWGLRVHAYLLTPRTDADPNYAKLVERAMPVTVAADDPRFERLESALQDADAVIDALLGAGRARPIDGALAGVLDRVSAAGKLVVAVDLPTGVDCDTAAADPHALRAAHTITLGFSKVGLHTLPGADYAGRVVVVDIGLPPDASRGLPFDLLSDAWLRERLPARPAGANKGTFGRVLVVAGSRSYVGAARLAALGADRVGAGLVTVACPGSVQPLIAASLTEATYLPLPELDGMLAERAATAVMRALPDYDVLLAGCGLGRSAGVRAFLRSLLFALEPSGPRLLLDADALNALALTPYWWRELHAPAVLTPHPGEMARLTGLLIGDIQSDRLGVALRFAREWGQPLVLKGAFTVVASPDGRAAISPFASAALASAGTGDVLAGAIAGLMAQGLAPFEAACCGVYLHAAAAARLSRDLGDAGLLAGDLPPQLPKTIREVKSP